jgi:hypothetical protein
LFEHKISGIQQSQWAGDKMAGNNGERLPIERRKQIFLDLVQTQAADNISVAEARRRVAQQYGITEAEVRAIEEEGVQHEWPPL